MADKVMTIESWTDGGDNIVRLLGLGARSYSATYCILSTGHGLAQVKRERDTHVPSSLAFRDSNLTLVAFAMLLTVYVA